jgi:hypothetical protein
MTPLGNLGKGWSLEAMKATVSSMGITLTGVLVTVLSIVILSMLDALCSDKELYENGTASRQYTVTWIALAVVAAWCLLLSVGGASAFIYFQF